MSDDLFEKGQNLIANAVDFVGYDRTNQLLPNEILSNVKIKIGDNFAIARFVDIVKRGKLNRLNQIVRLNNIGPFNEGGGISGKFIMRVIGPKGANKVYYGPSGSTEHTTVEDPDHTTIAYISFSEGNAKRFDHFRDRMQNTIIRDYLQKVPPKIKERTEIWLKYHKIGGY